MTERRPRGRPRNFDPDVALAAALETFRRHGYSGTSVTDLSAATGLNPPSLYAAFGNKESLFEAAIDLYWARVARVCVPALRGRGDLAADLTQFLAAFLDLFADEEPGGCVIACGLPSEVDRWPSLQEKLAGMFAAADVVVTQRLEEARAAGQLSGAVQVEALAQIIVSAMFGWSLRSRAGASRSELERQTIELVSVVSRSGEMREISRT
jgi:AcrR family transcriptional regulator